MLGDSMIHSLDGSEYVEVQQKLIELQSEMQRLNNERDKIKKLLLEVEFQQQIATTRYLQAIKAWVERPEIGDNYSI